MKKSKVIILAIIVSSLYLVISYLVTNLVNDSTTILSVRSTETDNEFIVRIEIPEGYKQVVMSPEEIKSLGGTIPTNGYWQKYTGPSLYGDNLNTLTNSKGWYYIPVVITAFFMFIVILGLSIIPRKLP